MSLSLILIVINTCLAFIGILFAWAVYQSEKRPSNRPSKFIKKSESSKLIVFIGDSITHGRVSSDYTKLVTERLNSAAFEFVNAGVNGELAWNILTRIDDVVKLQPDYITLMIGTNDGMASLSEKDGKFYRRKANLPQNPSVDWYQEMMREIVKKLKSETSAKIAVLSIPPLGEIPSHPAFLRSQELAAISQDIAGLFDVEYLAVNEAMCEYLHEHPSEPKSYFKNRIREIIFAFLKHYILRRSWDRISSDEGFNLLIDHVHLNSKSASIVAEMILEFISG